MYPGGPIASFDRLKVKNSALRLFLAIVISVLFVVRGSAAGTASFPEGGENDAEGVVLHLDPGGPHAAVSESGPEKAAGMSPAKTEGPRWAVKTDLLYWMALAPNVEGEYYFARRWSVNLALQVAWWHMESTDRYYQLFMATPEVRYWPGRRSAGEGWYAGLYATTGCYDLKWGERGYQSDKVRAAGISCGYILPLRGRMALELGLGVGYLETEYKIYKRYHPMERHYVYEGTDRTTFFGPTKAVVGLAWRFGKGGGK